MSWASTRLVTSLERIGARLGFTDGLLGIVTALGGDAPEISSAIAALLSSHHELAVGVVIGSNIFNLAGLLGLSALVAGRVSIGRHGLWLNGGTSLVVSIVILALLLQWVTIWPALIMLTLVLVPYVSLTAMHPTRIGKLKLPTALKGILNIAIGHAHRDASKHATIPHASWKDVVWLVLALGLIIGSSFTVVDTIVSLGSYLDINHAILGMLMLASLTSIPNLTAAVHLAREGRGAAVISESLNSNTLNILFGICLPVLIIGFEPPTTTIIYATIWLLCMKLYTLFATSHHGLHRKDGMVIIVLYLIFALAVITR